MDVKLLDGTTAFSAPSQSPVKTAWASLATVGYSPSSPPPQHSTMTLDSGWKTSRVFLMLDRS